MQTEARKIEPIRAFPLKGVKKTSCAAINHSYMITHTVIRQSHGATIIDSSASQDFLFFLSHRPELSDGLMLTHPPSLPSSSFSSSSSSSPAPVPLCFCFVFFVPLIPRIVNSTLFTFIPNLPLPRERAAFDRNTVRRRRWRRNGCAVILTSRPQSVKRGGWRGGVKGEKHGSRLFKEEEGT